MLLAQVKAHLGALQVENDHLTREIAILRETVKVTALSPFSISYLSQAGSNTVKVQNLMALNVLMGGEPKF